MQSLDMSLIHTRGMNQDQYGRGRRQVYDNIFAERLWRTVKYEEVYLHDDPMVSQARDGLTNHFLFYNRETSSSEC